MLKLTHLALAVLLGLAAVPAQAQGTSSDAPKLTIYTYDGFAADWGPGGQLKAGFEARCSCTVEFVAADSSIGTLRKVQLEGDSTPADLIVGLDTAIAGEARATGLFADHGLDLANLNLPEKWTDQQFVPFDYSHFAIMYDTDRTKTPPKSFEELIAMPASVKISIQDPRSSTPGFGLVLWIKAAYGDRAKDIWAGLKPHILTVTRDWSESYDLFLKGEADLTLSYTTSPAYHIIEEKKDTIKAAIFDEGHLAQIEVAGILKSSKHQQLAKDFLAYLTSVNGQKILPTTNWMFPVVDLGADTNAVFGTLPQPTKTLSVSDADIAAHGKEWIDEMLKAIQ
ncbi:thiamine ABC transporter substrate binding subunit [Devosia sp.]|uniref:thiamine ABC transporter substrate binding subunit n=1 Tax=Devosia sp. TaxID=1871048 RepID=UPI00326730AF